MLLDFHNLQDGNSRGVPALQAIQYLCTKYNVNGADNSVYVQGIIEDLISCFPRAVELADQFTEVKETCRAHEKKYETEVLRLMDIAVQQTLIQRKPAETQENAFGAVVLLASSLKKAADESCDLSGKHGKQHLIERMRSEGGKAQLVELTNQVTALEELRRVFRSKGNMALEVVKTLDAHRRNVEGNVHKRCSKMCDFRTRMAENFDDEALASSRNQ